MRAGPLSERRVIDLLNRNFVCVYTATEDYVGEGKAPVDERGELHRLCLHCDAEMDPEEVRWVEESALDDLGYGVRGDSGGCGRPGCGKGRCGRT